MGRAVPGMFADCSAAGGHVIHYAGGYTGADGRHGPCGTIIDNEQYGISSTGWLDANLCTPVAADPGSSTTGRAFRSAVASSGGVVASVSPMASQVEARVGAIFAKLGLATAPDGHRRVLAVLTYLRSSQ